MKPKKPKGFGKFDKLMQKLVKVPATEVIDQSQRMHSWEYHERRKEKWWQCVECDEVFLHTGKHICNPPPLGCTWKNRK